MAQEIADSKLLDTWGSGGTKIEPDISKIIEGWQLGEQPPHEYMNWLQNTFGSKLNHILKNGVSGWNNETEYLAGSSVQHSGNVWICETTNTNSEPTDLNANWEKVAISKDLTVTVDTLADLRSISYPGNTVWVSGYHTKNDGAFGSHIFRLKGIKTTETDNGGTIIIATIGGTDYVYELQFDGAVNVKWFGAKGDYDGTTGTDDSAALAACFFNHNNIEGNEGETYILTSVITSSFTDFKLTNINIVSDSNIETLASIRLVSNNVIIDNLKVDLGRGTYKIGIEKWTEFSTEGGTPSITPVLDSFLHITSISEDAVVKLSNCSFFNIANKDAIWVRCYGDVFLNNLTFNNCSEKTYNIYHTDVNGVLNIGRTFASNVRAIGVGILPDSFYVDGILKDSSDNYAPQASFNFVVTYGEYYLNNAYCKDYASCGVAADRNTYFNGTNITVECHNSKAWSSNPSGAIWDENCINFNLSNVTVDILNRDPRDLNYDSSALQLYSTSDGNSRTLSNIVLNTNNKVTRTIRGSKVGNCNILISNLKIKGTKSINLAGLPNDIVGGVLKIDGLSSNEVSDFTLNCSGFSNVSYSNINADYCNVVVKKADNTGVTGDLNNVKISNSSVKSFLCKDSILNGLILGLSNFSSNVQYIENMSIGRFIIDSCNIYGQLRYIPGSSTLPADRKMTITNSIISNGVRAYSLDSLIVSGNELKERNIQIDNIRYVKIDNNFIKSLSAEPVIHLTTTYGSYRIVTITNNTLLIQSGVVGGSYVFAPTLVAPYQIQDMNNIKVNFTI